MEIIYFIQQKQLHPHYPEMLPSTISNMYARNQPLNSTRTNPTPPPTPFHTNPITTTTTTTNLSPPPSLLPPTPTPPHLTTTTTNPQIKIKTNLTPPLTRHAPPPSLIRPPLQT